MIYNHMPDWLYASKDITSTSKLLMERIFSLSKEGTQEVYIKRAFFAGSLGVSERTLSRCFQELIQLGLIEEISNSNSFDKCKIFVVTKKACSDIPCLTSQNESISDDEVSSQTGQNVPIENDKMSTETGQNVTLNRTKCPKKQDKMSQKAGQNVSSSLDRSIGRIKGRYIYSATQKKDTKKTDKVVYPTNAKDCELLFESYIAKHQREQPVLNQLPLKMEAERFFLYWSEKEWMRGKTQIKSLAGCVATWVGNWLDRNERRYPKTMTPRTLEQEITSYRAYGEEVERFVKEREQQGKTSLTIEDFQVIAG